MRGSKTWMATWNIHYVLKYWQRDIMKKVKWIIQMGKDEANEVSCCYQKMLKSGWKILWYLWFVYSEVVPGLHCIRLRHSRPSPYKSHLRHKQQQCCCLHQCTSRWVNSNCLCPHPTWGARNLNLITLFYLTKNNFKQWQTQ